MRCCALCGAVIVLQAAMDELIFAGSAINAMSSFQDEPSAAMLSAASMTM